MACGVVVRLTALPIGHPHHRLARHVVEWPTGWSNGLLLHRLACWVVDWHVVRSIGPLGCRLVCRMVDSHAGSSSGQPCHLDWGVVVVLTVLSFGPSQAFELP